MNLSILNSQVPARIAARMRRVAFNRGRSIAAGAAGLAVSFAYAGHALAAAATAASPTGSLGDQLNTMSSEALNSGSTAFGMLCYLAATVSFFGGVWAAWQSRQPQNRDSGYMMRAAAGMVLCGLFATGGVWINKAAVTATGSSASINTTPGMVQFGAGATAG